MKKEGLIAFLVFTAIMLVNHADAWEGNLPKAESFKSVSGDSTVDVIIKVQNWKTNTDTCKLNDILAFTVKTKKNADYFNTLYVNSVAVSGAEIKKRVTAYDSCPDQKMILVKLTKKFQDSLIHIFKGLHTGSGFLDVNISIGNADQQYPLQTFPFTLEETQLIDGWVVNSLMALIILLLVILMWKYNASIIKDGGKYYSLGRTQLLYWSLLIIYGYLYVCSRQGALPVIPASMLIILGISIGTTAATKIISNNTSYAPDPNPSQGFLVDILSDANSINVHRFQNVIFNIVFGAIFMHKVISDQQLPDFDNTALTLMGISAASYAALKTTENNSAKDNSTEPKPV